MKEILYLCSVFIKLVYRMDAKKILFIAQEITPYLPESEIATICRNLPQGIQERGREIRTFMPKFGSINERRNQLHEVIRLSGMNLIIDDTDHPLIIKVASIQAARMQVYFIDNEDLFFPKTDPNYIYASPRTREEAEKMLFHAIKVHENFVFAAVKGDYGEAIYPFFQYAVLIDTPKDIRVQRVKKRSFQKFGKRMLPGGDLHEQEEKFFEFVTSRPESTVEEWIQLLSCPILRIDGTKPVEENVDFIINQI